MPLEALPIIRERFPQTLYWNPEATTDAGGRVQVTIPTGDTITSWRITAQAVDRNGKLGSNTVTKCLGGVRLTKSTLAGSTLTMDQALRNLVKIAEDKKAA